MNDVVNKRRNKRKDVITEAKKEIFIVLPYLGIQRKIVTQQLKSGIYKFYGCFNPKIIFRNTRRIKSFFPYKDDENVMIALLGKQNVDYMTGKRNIQSRR